MGRSERWRTHGIQRANERKVAGLRNEVQHLVVLARDPLEPLRWRVPDADLILRISLDHASLPQLEQALDLLDALLHLEEPSEEGLCLAHLLPLAQYSLHLFPHGFELVLDARDFCSDGEDGAADCGEGGGDVGVAEAEGEADEGFVLLVDNGDEGSSESCKVGPELRRVPSVLDFE